MSRVIKAAIWRDEPHLVEQPPMPQKTIADAAPERQEETQAVLMAAIMEKEKITFMWYLKKITPLAVAGYIAGIVTYLLIGILIH